jgi:acyl-CoA thioester hydrolase
MTNSGTAAAPPSSPARAKPAPSKRGDFAWFDEMTTRWNDNDIYGHMNNAVHYTLFDTAVNRWLRLAGKQDFKNAASIGLVVHNHCDYYADLSYPDKIVAGIRVERLGNSSVTYRVALFAEHEDVCAAEGLFVHVYVDRHTRRPTPIEAGLRAAMQGIAMA